jgi:uncharacterized protein (TIGR02145 family)
MENSENKSLISTGSSNLAKTEKLLSVTQKILSEIKPQYESVRIGNQEWMTRNLDVDRFRNGDLIPHIKSNEEWKKAGENGQSAWCYYDNDPEYREKYGKLYNWFSIADSRNICPIGWDIPSDVDLTILVDVFGGSTDAGGKLKDIGTTVWNAPNLAATNESGFSMLPSGIRLTAGNYENIKNNGYLWSKSEYDVNYSWFRGFSRSDVIVSRALANKRSALSIRCIRN